MDAFTLAVAAGLAAMIMAGSMGLLYLASARKACLLDWAVAGLLFACSNAVAAAGIRAGAMPMLLVAGVNTLHAAGHFGILAGVRRHLRLAPGWGWGALLMAGILLGHALPYVQVAPLHRMVLGAPVICAVTLGAAWLLWRRGGALRAACLPLIVLELVAAFQHALRVAIVVAGEYDPSGSLAARFFRVSGGVSMLVFLSVAAMACAVIVMHEQTLALRCASLTDVLTGWLNRRALQDSAARALRRCRKDGAALHFLIFDIDHFKAINDRHGHGVGDAAICHVTALAAQVLHGCDGLFRIGGEEFAVLLAGRRPDDVRACAERLRAEIAATPLALEGVAVPMTVSVGIAAVGQHDQHWEDVLRRADEALYHAKQHGRDRVSVHGRDLAIRPAVDPAPRLHLVGV